MRFQPGIRAIYTLHSRLSWIKGAHALLNDVRGGKDIKMTGKGQETVERTAFVRATILKT